MANYIVRRLMIIPIILAGVSITIFLMLSMLTPYERAALYVGDIPKRQDAIDKIIEKYGLNDPIHVQYWNWMVGKKDPDTGEIKGGVLRGDFGWSKVGKSPVFEVIGRRLPASAEITLWSAFPLIGFGIWMGIKAAVNHNKFIDQVFRLSAVAGWSLPTFVFGLVLMMVFYADLDWFPAGRLSIQMSKVVYSDEFVRYTMMNTIDGLLNLRFDVFLDAVRHLVLPVVTLSVVSWAFLLRVTRSSMLDTLRQDYITTANAKGLPEGEVINRHAVPNALIPVITVAGLTLVDLLNGVVIAETVFAFPGLGMFLAEAATSLDVVSVLGVTLFTSIMLVFGNLIVDVLYGIVDPRIRLN